jgi:hypothetical protein
MKDIKRGDLTKLTTIHLNLNPKTICLPTFAATENSKIDVSVVLDLKDRKKFSKSAQWFFIESESF